jgi:uncharacterized glyoxalase superfamily protein PhnB
MSVFYNSNITSEGKLFIESNCTINLSIGVKSMSIKLDMIGIVVKDMKKALDFYRVLGFSIPEKLNVEPHVEVNQNGFRLAFDTQEMISDIYGGWEDPTGHRIELAFLCESKDSLNDLYKKILNHGYVSHREPWDAFWGQRYAIIIDPDGNLISLFA